MCVSYITYEKGGGIGKEETNKKKQTTKAMQKKKMINISTMSGVKLTLPGVRWVTKCKQFIDGDRVRLGPNLKHLLLLYDV